MLTLGLGWLFRILSRLSKDWRERCSWGSFSDLLTSLSKQMLDELPCLKWKSPQEILAVPHIELTSTYYWTPCCCFPQRHPPTLSFHKADYYGLLHFCHATTPRTPPRFPSLLQPCYPPIWWFYMPHLACSCALSPPITPTPPSQKMILAPLTARRRTSKMAQLDTKHLLGSTGEGWGWWGDFEKAGGGCRVPVAVARDPCGGRGSPCRAGFVKQAGRWRGAEERGFTIFRWRQAWGAAAFPTTPCLEGASSYWKDSHLARSACAIFLSWKSCSIQCGVSFAPSTAIAEQEIGGTYGQASAVQLCQTAVCRHGLLLPRDDSRDQRLEQQPHSNSTTLLSWLSADCQIFRSFAELCLLDTKCNRRALLRANNGNGKGMRHRARPGFFPVAFFQIHFCVTRTRTVRIQLQVAELTLVFSLMEAPLPESGSCLEGRGRTSKTLIIWTAPF